MILTHKSNLMNSLGGMKKMKQTEKKFDKRIFKKSPEELEQYMMFKRRGSRVENKKGKGSFKRHPKHKGNYEDKYCA